MAIVFITVYKLHIQKTREGVAIVSVQCIKLNLLIKQIREGVAIVFKKQFKNCIYTHLLIQKKRKGAAIASVQCIKLDQLIN